jgi:anthranilate synthase component 1
MGRCEWYTWQVYSGALCPDREAFRAWQRAGRMVPVYRAVLADWQTPLSAFHRVAGEEPYAFLLESVSGGERIARYSFIGVAPFAIFRSKGRVARLWERGTGWRTLELPPHHDPLHAVRALLRRYVYQRDTQLPRFSGGRSAISPMTMCAFWNACLTSLPTTFRPMTAA